MLLSRLSSKLIQTNKSKPFKQQILLFSSISKRFNISAMSTTTPNHNFNIILNPTETRIADLLVGCAKWIENNPEEVDALRLKDEEGNWIGKARGNEPLELRIAGGWVRDKLLGASSDDIDISIFPDPITGVKFASLLEKYLEVEGKSELMGKLTAIEARPEQSKHLETATAIVENLSIDFVHQRGHESYAEDSRIPIVSFGTPLEDALRRDLTINALFYNLQSRTIEDETGKGLADLGLIEGISPCIRTPLPPFETFRDDPLRVVRAVRFAARFGEEFKIADDLVEAVGREEIRSALRDGKKIARDRVGVEVGKMLMGNNPYLAMQIIFRLNLHPLIFLYDPSETFYSNQVGPSSTIPPTPDISDSIKSCDVISHLLSSSLRTTTTQTQTTLHLKQHLHPLLQFKILDSPSSEELREINSEIVKRFYLSAAVLPFHDLSIIEKKKPLWLGEKIIKDGLKFKTSDKVWAAKAKESCSLLSEAVKRFGIEEVETSQAVLEIGLLLRNKVVHDPLLNDVGGTRWNTSLFWSLVVDLCHEKNGAELAILKRYYIFIQRVLASELETRAFALPLLNGNEILDLIDEVKGVVSTPAPEFSNSIELDPSKPPAKRKSSQAVAEIAEHIIKWQLINPTATKDECRNWLKGDERQQVLNWIELYSLKNVAAKVKKRQKQDI